MNFADAVQPGTVRRTCTACPTQYQGQMADGRWFYFRYRGGIADLGLGDTFDQAAEETFPRGQVPAISLGDRWDGYLSEEEFREVFMRLLALRGDRDAGSTVRAG